MAPETAMMPWLAVLAMPALVLSLILTAVGIAQRSWVAMLFAAICSYPMRFSFAIGLFTFALTFMQLGVAVAFRWRWHWLIACGMAVLALGVYIGMIAGIEAGVL